MLNIHFGRHIYLIPSEFRLRHKPREGNLPAIMYIHDLFGYPVIGYRHLVRYIVSRVLFR